MAPYFARRETWRVPGLADLIAFLTCSASAYCEHTAQMVVVVIFAVQYEGNTEKGRTVAIDA